MEPVEISVATKSDAPSIGRLHFTNFKENNDTAQFSAHDLETTLPVEFCELWQRRIAQAAVTEHILVAKRGGDLLGFVCVLAASDAQWGSLIDNLHVDRASRRSGVGHLLMKGAAAWLREHHPRMKVHLHVLESNSNARRFYERLGARHLDTICESTHGGGVVRNCRYVWSDPHQI